MHITDFQLQHVEYTLKEQPLEIATFEFSVKQEKAVSMPDKGKETFCILKNHLSVLQKGKDGKEQKVLTLNLEYKVFLDVQGEKKLDPKTMCEYANKMMSSAICSDINFYLSNAHLPWFPLDRFPS